MTIYYVIIFTSLIFGFVYNYSDVSVRKIVNITFIVFFMILIGLRKEVGVDWYQYIDMYKRLNLNPFGYDSNELFYKYLNVLSFYTIFGFGFVVFSTTLIFIVASIKGPEVIGVNPYYFFAICGSYYFVMASLNFIRQGVALAVMLIAFAYLLKGNKLKFLIYTFVAGMFHTSAFLLMIFVIADMSAVVIIAATVLLLAGIIYFPMERYQMYLTSDMENAGLFLRLGYLIAPSIYIIYNYKSWFKEVLLVKRLYMISIMSVPVIVVLNLISSTIADRVAYYFIVLITLLSMYLMLGLKDKVSKFTAVIMFLSSMIAFIVWCDKSKYIYFYHYKSYIIDWLS